MKQVSGWFDMDVWAKYPHPRNQNLTHVLETTPLEAWQDNRPLHWQQADAPRATLLKRPIWTDHEALRRPRVIQISDTAYYLLTRLQTRFNITNAHRRTAHGKLSATVEAIMGGYLRART